MKELNIKCNNASFDTVYFDNQVELTLQNIDLSFLHQIESKDIVYNCGDVQGLFEKIMELEDVEDMLKEFGYIKE